MLFRNFHKKTGVSSIRDVREVFDQLPPPTKEYPRLSSITLPEPHIPNLPFSDVLASRATHRDFDEEKEISLETLSTVLFSGAGIQKKIGRNEDIPSRHHPSGGALYPLECYVAAFRINSLESGLYHYNARAHSLERLPGDEETIWESCKDMVPAHKPACILVTTSVWDRSYPKYGEFAYRLALMEAGHLTQDMLLTSAALDLKNCPATGFAEETVSKTLDIEHDAEDPLYLLLLGL